MAQPNDDAQAPELAEQPATVSGEYQQGATSERLRDEGQIARGGMGAVRRVLNSNLLRREAMKVADPRKFRDPLDLVRFWEEAQITGQLEHPNIVPVHEVGTTEQGRHFFTMALVKGDTLEKLLGKGFDPTDEAQLYRVLQVFLQVCQAVSFAHAHGVVHCDIKPSNIMVGAHGQVYLMDWGIARVRGQQRKSGADRTQVTIGRDQAEGDAGKVMGTLTYMSPEQAHGRTEEIDERSDVFGLGGLLYRMLAGRPPYMGKTLEEIFQKAKEASIVAPQDLVKARLPYRLCRTAMRALSAERKDRQQSVEELRQEVEDFLRGAGRYVFKSFAAGELVFREGDAPDAMYVVVRGRARAFKTVDGTRYPLREMGPGEVFGETALLDTAVRTASVEAVDALTVVVVTPGSLEQEFGQTFWVGHIVKAMARRFLDLDAGSSALLARAEAGELAREVLSYACFHGEMKGGVRTAPWAPLWKKLVRALGRPEDEVLELVQRSGLADVDLGRDLLTLRDPAEHRAPS